MQICFQTKCILLIFNIPNSPALILGVIASMFGRFCDMVMVEKSLFGRHRIMHFNGVNANAYYRSVHYVSIEYINHNI